MEGRTPPCEKAGCSHFGALVAPFPGKGVMTMRFLLKPSIACAAAVMVWTAALGGDLGSAASAPKVQLRIAFPTEKGGLGDRQVQTFVSAINREIPDVFQIATYPGSQLGTGTENVQAVETGTLECAALGSEGEAVDPQLGFFDLPWTFSGFGQFRRAVSGSLFDPIAQVFAKHGLHLVAIYGFGFRDLLTKSPVNALTDLKGRRIRIAPAPSRVAFFRLLTATPVTIEWANTYIALEQGTVDGVEAFPQFLRSGRMYEQAKYLDDFHYNSQPSFIVFSDRFWSALPRGVQAGLLKAGRESMTPANALAESTEAEDIGFMKMHGVRMVKTDLGGYERIRATLSRDYTKQFGDSWLKAVANARQ